MNSATPSQTYFLLVIVWGRFTNSESFADFPTQRPERSLSLCADAMPRLDLPKRPQTVGTVFYWVVTSRSMRNLCRLLSFYFVLANSRLPPTVADFSRSPLNLAFSLVSLCFRKVFNLVSFNTPHSVRYRFVNFSFIWCNENLLKKLNVI